MGTPQTDFYEKLNHWTTNNKQHIFRKIFKTFHFNTGLSKWRLVTERDANYIKTHKWRREKGLVHGFSMVDDCHFRFSVNLYSPVYCRMVSSTILLCAPDTSSTAFYPQFWQRKLSPEFAKYLLREGPWKNHLWLRSTGLGRSNTHHVLGVYQWCSRGRVVSITWRASSSHTSLWRLRCATHTTSIAYNYLYLSCPLSYLFSIVEYTKTKQFFKA